VSRSSKCDLLLLLAVVDPIDARHCACLANLKTVATAVGTVTDNDLLNGVAVHSE
jgi:hypothetical protein